MDDIFGMFDDMTPEEAKREIADFQGSMVGETLDATQIAMVAWFADLAVEAAVAEICAIAAAIGADSVPVQVLREYGKHQSVASQILWQMAEASGADMAVSGVSVPDDLSGLDGE